eukprot:9352327-Pyramimonas_sp.AAC.1
MVGAVHVVVCSLPGVEEKPTRAWRLQCWVKGRAGASEASFGAACTPQVAEHVDYLFLQPEDESAVGLTGVL